MIGEEVPAQDGSLVDVEWRRRSPGNDKGRVLGRHDVTERKEAERPGTGQPPERADPELPEERICGLDAQNIAFVNPAASRIPARRTRGPCTRPSPLLPRRHPLSLEDCPIYAAFGDGEVHRSSDEVFWRRTAPPCPSVYDNPIRENDDLLVGAVEHPTQRKRIEEEIRHLNEVWRHGSSNAP